MFSIFKKKKVTEKNETKEKNEEKEEYFIKIVLLGDGGKTSLCRRFTESNFDLYYMPTLGKKIFN